MGGEIGPRRGKLCERDSDDDGLGGVGVEGLEVGDDGPPLVVGEEDSERVDHFAEGLGGLKGWGRLVGGDVLADLSGVKRYLPCQVGDAELVGELLEQMAAKVGVVLPVKVVEGGDQDEGLGVIDVPNLAAGVLAAQSLKRCLALVAVKDLPLACASGVGSDDEGGVIAGSADVRLELCLIG